MDFGGTAEKLTHLQGQGPAEEVERRLARELTSKTRVSESIWNWRANAWTSERLDGRTCLPWLLRGARKEGSNG